MKKRYKENLLKKIRDSIKAFDFLIFEFEQCIISYNVISETITVFKKKHFKKSPNDITVQTGKEITLFFILCNEIESSEKDFQLWEFQYNQKIIFAQTVQEMYNNLLPF